MLVLVKFGAELIPIRPAAQGSSARSISVGHEGSRCHGENRNFSFRVFPHGLSEIRGLVVFDRATLSPGRKAKDTTIHLNQTSGMETNHVLVRWPGRSTLLMLSITAAPSATLNFTFTIDEPSFTSAGVFQTNGTLVNTMWRKVRYDPGTYNAAWGGSNDQIFE